MKKNTKFSRTPEEQNVHQGKQTTNQQEITRKTQDTTMAKIGESNTNGRK